MISEEDKEKVESIIHPKVRNIIRICVEGGCRFRQHPGNPNLYNLFEPLSKKIIIGDINPLSQRGYFTLEAKNGRFKSFRNEMMGLDINHANFEENVLKLLKQ
jgi:hypothetical protein